MILNFVSVHLSNLPSVTLLADRLSITIIKMILDFFKCMWYLRIVASSCKQFGPASTCSRTKYRKMLEKMKTDVDKLLSVLSLKNKFPIDFTKIDLFFYFSNQKLAIYVRLYLLYYFPNFMYFGHKHVEIIGIHVLF